MPDNLLVYQVLFNNRCLIKTKVFSREGQRLQAALPALVHTYNLKSDDTMHRFGDILVCDTKSPLADIVIYVKS